MQCKGAGQGRPAAAQSGNRCYVFTCDLVSVCQTHAEASSLGGVSSEQRGSRRFGERNWLGHGENRWHWRLFMRHLHGPTRAGPDSVCCSGCHHVIESLHSQCLHAQWAHSAGAGAMLGGGSSGWRQVRANQLSMLHIVEHDNAMCMMHHLPSSPAACHVPMCSSICLHPSQS